MGLLDGGVDRGLEPLLVDDQVGAADLRGLRGGELQVVRLRPGLGQVHDVRVVARDPLGDELERVERGHDLSEPLAATGRVVAKRRAAAVVGGQEQGGGHEQEVA